MPFDRPAKLAAAVILAAFAATAPAQPGRDVDDGRVIAIAVPQFVVHAESFHAVDETGWFDWTGSDEVRAVFADFNPINERATKEYDNVDTGETVAFIAADRCISPQPDCSAGREFVHFGVALWEADADVGLSGLLGLRKPDRAGAHDMYETGIDGGDDLIGRALVGWSRTQLLGTLPNIGDTVERQVQLHGGDGNYRFNYRITRLPDVRREIVIDRPREP